MAIVQAHADYTDKDLASLRTRIYALVASVFPEWTDQNVSNFGNLLVELYAFVGDILCFYQDSQAGESRITTATQRRSLIALSKLVGFTPSGASAATTDVTISLDAPTEGSVTFAAGQIVATADVTTPVEFQVLEATTITAGGTSVTAAVENSKSVEETFTSSGLPNQEFALAETPYLDDSAIVTAGDGDYEQIDNFLASTATDRHYTVAVDQSDRARVRFGNGVAGAIPVGSVTVEYKTGGGAAGNVPAGAIKIIDGSFTDSLGNPVTPSVTNPTKASGGTNRMSNATIKSRAPASVRAPVNSVAREDFEINALRLATVARALMLTSNEDPGVPENTGNLYIVPTGGGLPSTSLKNQVKTQVTVTYPSILTFQVNVLDPLYLAINVTAVVYLRKGVTPASARAQIEEALGEWFAIQNADGAPNEQIDFGAKYKKSDGTVDAQLPWSDIFNAVRDADGVRKVDPAGFFLNGARTDVSLLGPQFPQLGSISLVDGDTGLSF